MTNELTISNEELLAATGEDQQQGSGGLIKYVKLLQKHTDNITERYNNLISLHPEQKKELQEKMLKELEAQIPLGTYVCKNGNDESGNPILENLGKPFVGQILKTRYSWATKMGIVPALHTSEVDLQAGIVKIYNDADEHIDTLMGTMIKAKYPNLKMQNPLYVCDQASGTLYKITVKGGSFTNWFDYLKTFPKGVSKSSFETIFDSVKETMKDPATGATNEYYAMTFKRGSQIEDTRKTLQMLRELNALLGTSPASSDQQEYMTPSEAVAAISASVDSFESSITESTPAPKPITQQKLTPNLRERTKMVQEASSKMKAKSGSEADDMPAGFGLK